MRNERGFALPLTIFLITILTILLAAGFARVSVDREIAKAGEESVDALAVAQSGLQTYLATTTSRPAQGDSLRVNVPGGYAWVTPQIVKVPTDTMANWTYVIQSTGYVIVASLGSTPRASRTIAQFAYWQTGSMNLLAGFTAANQLQVKHGGKITRLRGYDVCHRDTTLPSIRVPSGPVLNGLDAKPAPVFAGNGMGVSTATEIDWPAILNGGLQPDYTSFQQANFNQVTVIQGDATLDETWGGGILVVTGDLTVTHDFVFRGILLVGGLINFNSSYAYVRGAVVSGLNEQLSQNVKQGAIGENGGTYIYYDSCAVNDALSNLTGFVPVSNAWIDNWATY